MSFCDYVVKQTDDEELLAKRILYSAFIRRVKGDKPASTLVTGGSGEGKSMGVVRLQEVLLEIQGLKLTPDIVKAINIFTPLEYGEKMEKLLYSKELKKINIVALHEARDIVSASNWQDFLTKAVASINTQSRKIKPLIIFIISQHLSDIARSTRITCQYYIEAQRSIGKHTRFKVNKIWEKKHGLEKSELMPRKLCGYVVDEKGKYRRHYLTDLEMTLPSKENVEAFDRLDTEAKAAILANKMAEVLRKIKQEAGDYGNKLNAMVEWYCKDPAKIETIGKRYRGEWKVKEEIIKAHDLTNEEARIFQGKLTEKIKSMGLFEEVTE